MSGSSPHEEKAGDAGSILRRVVFADLPVVSKGENREPAPPQVCSKADQCRRHNLSPFSGTKESVPNTA